MAEAILDNAKRQARKQGGMRFMLKRFSKFTILFLLLAAFCLPAFAFAEGELALTAASGYEDGFVLTASNLAQQQEGILSNLFVLYVPQPQGVQESSDLTNIDGCSRVPFPLPIETEGVIVFTGLNLTSGSSYLVQIEGTYANGSDSIGILSNVVSVTVAQGLMPTTPSSIAFVNKTETIFEGQTLNLPMMIEPLSSGKAYLTYTSSKEKIATVDDKGIVTGIAKGKTIITANGITQDGKKLKASVAVQVNRPVTQLVPNKTDILLAVEKKTSVKISAAPNTASDKSGR